MKKILLAIIIFGFTFVITACSNSSILKNYPEVEKDFSKSDYNKLEELSEDGSISYEELCQKYVESSLPESTLKMINNLKELSEVSNLSCNKDEESLTISYDLMFKDVHNIGVGDMHTTIEFISDPVNFNLKKITYDVSELQHEPKTFIISSIENSKEDSDKILRSTQDEERIKNKIYTISANYYYMPIENKTETIIINIDDIDKSYQSYDEYMDKQIEEFDNQIDELEKSLEKTEELYGR